MVTITAPDIEAADLRAMIARLRLLIARYDAESADLRAVIEALRTERVAVEDVLGRAVRSGALGDAVRDALELP